MSDPSRDVFIQQSEDIHHNVNRTKSCTETVLKMSAKLPPPHISHFLEIIRQSIKNMLTKVQGPFGAGKSWSSFRKSLTLTPRPLKQKPASESWESFLIQAHKGKSGDQWMLPCHSQL